MNDDHSAESFISVTLCVSQKIDPWPLTLSEFHQWKICAFVVNRTSMQIQTWWNLRASFCIESIESLSSQVIIETVLRPWNAMKSGLKRAPLLISLLPSCQEQIASFLQFLLFIGFTIFHLMPGVTWWRQQHGNNSIIATWATCHGSEFAELQHLLLPPAPCSQCYVLRWPSPGSFGSCKKWKMSKSARHHHGTPVCTLSQHSEKHRQTNKIMNPEYCMNCITIPLDIYKHIWHTETWHLPTDWMNQRLLDHALNLSLSSSFWGKSPASSKTPRISVSCKLPFPSSHTVEDVWH